MARKSDVVVRRGAWRKPKLTFDDHGTPDVGKPQEVQQPITKHPAPQKHTPED